MSQFNLNRKWIFEYDDQTVLRQEDTLGAAETCGQRDSPGVQLPDVVCTEITRLDERGQQADAARH